MLANSPSGFLVFLMVLFFGAIAGLNLFGFYSCINLYYSPDPPPPKSLLTLALCELASVGLALFVVIVGEFKAMHFLMIGCTLPLLLYTWALLLWWVRRVAKKQ